MRYLFLTAALAASAASAQTTSVSNDDLQHAQNLGASYRQCLRDTLGDRYLDRNVPAPMTLAAEIEQSCAGNLQPVQRFLTARGYAATTVREILVDIKARADGAAIAALHRLPRYRL